MSYSATEHDWVTEDLRALRRDFLLQDLESKLAAAGFTGCVAVQARQSQVENKFLLAQAGRTPVVRAVVGWLDLRAPDIADQIDMWAAHPKFVGIRHVLIDEPDDQYMLRPEFVRGLRALAIRHLTYDLLIEPRHFASAIATVDAHPDLRFVLDHAGLPDVRGAGLRLWQPAIAELAQRHNVACKLSGLEFMADWQDWSPQDLRPYQDAILQAFGPHRLMISFNWPICTVAGGYMRATNASLSLLDTLSLAERSAILGATCQQWYRFGS